MIVMGSNPLSSHADTQLIYQALKSLDLLVTLELTQTPTSMLADYVLPIAGGIERSVFQTNAGTANIAYGGMGAVPPYYERRPDFDFWRGLGIRMGQEKYWPWESFEESLEAALAPLGLTWKEFCEVGLYATTPVYRKFEKIGFDKGTPAGFATPSGKIELFSRTLADLGAEPLPDAKPLLTTDDKFNLRLISGARVQPFYASAFRQVEQLRQIHPVPLIEMGIKTARAHGLRSGEVVWVETRHGKALFQLNIIELREGTVSVEYGWWYPELSGDDFEDSLLISNANVLTNADFENCEHTLGQWQFNGIPCCIYPAGPDDLELFTKRSSLVGNLTI